MRAKEIPHEDLSDLTDVLLRMHAAAEEDAESEAPELTEDQFGPGERVSAVAQLGRIVESLTTLANTHAKLLDREMD